MRASEHHVVLCCVICCSAVGGGIGLVIAVCPGVGTSGVPSRSHDRTLEEVRGLNFVEDIDVQRILAPYRR